MSFIYRALRIKKPPTYSTASPVPVCTQGRVEAVAHIPSLPQCTYHESGGARCELHHKHEGGHAFPDAVFEFMQVRHGLIGPICRVRRGPPEYLYEEGPMCL